MKIIIFSGTSDGRKLAESLCERGCEVTVSVATEYGASLMGDINVICGRLDKAEMEDVIKPFDLVIDATHPYAEVVTKNIISICLKNKKKYIRLKRDVTDYDGCKICGNIIEATEYLRDSKDEIFVSTGSKELAAFECVGDRVTARVLDTDEVRKKCDGMKIKKIIYDMPPYSETDNLRDFNGCKILVTKDSGRVGGIQEKLSAAKKLGMEVVMIARPQKEDDGYSIEEIEKMITEKVVIRVGSRESKLAVAQTEIVINKIKKIMPNAEVVLVTMKTTGDKILDKTLDKVGGKGLFVKELDRALLNGEVDITVHSLKDMPGELESGLKIAAYIKREAANDVLVLPIGETEIKGAIGCASRRRASQLKNIFPDAEIKPIRGNVITRLKKLDDGEYGALVLAKAGLVRLGLSNRISREFSDEEILPASGQGIIAVETRENYVSDMFEKINDKNSEICANAERAFIKALDGGCSVPVAAYATTDGIGITINGMDARSGEVIKLVIRGDADDAKKLGAALAEGIRRESMMH